MASIVASALFWLFLGGLLGQPVLNGNLQKDAGGTMNEISLAKGVTLVLGGARSGKSSLC